MVSLSWAGLLSVYSNLPVKSGSAGQDMAGTTSIGGGTTFRDSNLLLLS